MRTVMLLTPDEVDAAARRSVDYRRPELDERGARQGALAADRLRYTAATRRLAPRVLSGCA